MTIDFYLESLRSELKGRMPDEVIDQRLRELETHLWMSAADHRKQGLDDTEAVHHAIAELGAVKVVADEMVRQRLGYGPGSKWSFSALADPALFIGIATPYTSARLLGLFWIHGISWNVAICDTAAWMAIVCLSAGAWRTRRWLVGPILKWVCPVVFVLGMASVLVFQARPQALGVNQRGKVAELRFSGGIRPQLEAVDEWKGGHPPTDAGPVSILSVRRTLVPLLPIPWERTGYTFWLGPMSHSEAELAWKKNGAEYARQLALFETSINESQSSYDSSLPSRMWRGAVWMAPTMAAGIALAFGLNGFVLVLASWSDGLRNRRLRRDLAIGS